MPFKTEKSSLGGFFNCQTIIKNCREYDNFKSLLQAINTNIWILFPKWLKSNKNIIFEHNFERAQQSQNHVKLAHLLCE